MSQNIPILIGALAGASAFIWDAINFIKDHRKISLYAVLGYDYDFVNGAKALLLSITNTSHIPVCLDCVGFIISKKKRSDRTLEHSGLGFDNSYQRVFKKPLLQPGESELVSFTKYKAYFAENRKYLFVRDSQGKYRSVKKRTLRKLSKAAASY